MLRQLGQQMLRQVEVGQQILRQVKQQMLRQVRHQCLTTFDKKSRNVATVYIESNAEIYYKGYCHAQRPLPATA